MAMNTLAAVKAAMKLPFKGTTSWTSNAANATSQLHSAWTTSNSCSNWGPWGAGAHSTTLNGVALSGAVAGRMPWLDPPTGEASVAAMRIGAQVGVAGVLIVADRIWQNGGIDKASTSAQAITTPTFPARDQNSSSNGVGYLMGLEISGASTTGGTPTITVSYTNSDGVSGRTATQINNVIGASAPTRCWMIGLQAGDVGVKSIESVTLGGTAFTEGTLNLVVFRPLVYCPISCFLNNLSGIDPISGQMPSIPRGAVLYLLGVNAQEGTGSFMATGVEITPAWE